MPNAETIIGIVKLAFTSKYETEPNPKKINRAVKLINTSIPDKQTIVLFIQTTSQYV